MKIAFDLDGTLYDTFPVGFAIDLTIRRELGYQDITAEASKRVFQSSDWRKFYLDSGIREEHVDYVIKQFVERFETLDMPYLIPGAREVLQAAEQVLGHKNIFIITNGSEESVRRRFERDGLMHHFDRVDNPYEGKAKELHKLATSNGGSTLYYVGDLVSDGEACKEARKLGAKNLRFIGMLHTYAYSPRDLMEQFAQENGEFAQVVESLQDLETFINGQNSGDL